MCARAEALNVPRGRFGGVCGWTIFESASVHSLRGERGVRANGPKHRASGDEQRTEARSGRAAGATGKKRGAPRRRAGAVRRNRSHVDPPAGSACGTLRIRRLATT